ncbi:MAG: hypothetical protein FWD17_06790 [Polyangiaceae bacterium]|nr:hypothetical protein [Polyangiaceae bacterium]
MDAPADQPGIVVEQSESCQRSQHAAAVLGATLAASRTPAAGFRVTMHVEEVPPQHTLRAEGDIVNAKGTVVARRSLAGAGGDCEGLARAIGIWASLVLEQESGRESGGAGAAAPVPAPRAAAVKPPSSGDTAAAGEQTPVAPAPESNPVPPPADAALPRRRDTSGAFQIGIGTFLMTGAGGRSSSAGAMMPDAVMGGTPYAILEVSPGLFLRPALMAGEALNPLGGSGNATAFFAAARVDACTRVPGNYTASKGLELTFCGGSDVGATYYPASPPGYSGLSAPRAGTTLPQASLGPSIDLRGELASDWSLVLRGVVGVNVIRNGFTDCLGNRVTPDWVSGRIELAVAWSVL